LPVINIFIYTGRSFDDELMKEKSAVYVFSSSLSDCRRIISYKKNLHHPLSSLLANQENIREKGSFVCAHSARDQRTCDRNPC
jgi:hypothetical protein